MYLTYTKVNPSSVKTGRCSASSFSCRYSAKLWGDRGGWVRWVGFRCREPQQGARPPTPNPWPSRAPVRDGHGDVPAEVARDDDLPLQVHDEERRGHHGSCCCGRPRAPDAVMVVELGGGSGSRSLTQSIYRGISRSIGGGRRHGRRRRRDGGGLGSCCLLLPAAACYLLLLPRVLID